MIQSIAGILVLIMLGLIFLFSFLDKRKKRSVTKKPAVSFIIPCYNDADSVGETIESIYTVAGSDVDVLVVNDQSTDNSAQVIQELQSAYGFRFISNPKNLGKSETLNRAFDQAKHDLVFFVDADMTLNKAAYMDALARLEDGQVGAVSCPYKPKNKGFIPLMQHIEYNMLTLVQGSYNIFSAIALWGGFIGIKKQAFLDAGRFSLNAITEDGDLAFKLNKQGWKVEQSFISMKTIAPASISEWYKQKIRWSSGGFQSYIKHLKVWIKNPIHVFFMLSYMSLMVGAAVGLSKNITFWGNVIEYFDFVNETVSLLASFKLTGLLYGVYIVKDLAVTLGFTFLALPYVFPLITGLDRAHLVLLVVPFSILYIPLFTIVSLLGTLYFFRHLYALEKQGVRAW